jgi:hypothetical protein
MLLGSTHPSGRCCQRCLALDHPRVPHSCLCPILGLVSIKVPQLNLIQKKNTDTHLSMHTTVDNAPLLLPLNVVLLVELGETPVVGFNDLLTASELELRTAKCFNGLHRSHRLSAHLAYLCGLRRQWRGDNGEETHFSTMLECMQHIVGLQSTFLSGTPKRTV